MVAFALPLTALTLAILWFRSIRCHGGEAPGSQGGW